jgi:MscS family membrane protein
MLRFWAAFALAAIGTWAQLPLTPAPARPETTSTAVQDDRVSPRGAVYGFLEAAGREDWRRAASYLNLRPLPPSRHEEQGPELARQLKRVLDRRLRTDPATLSSAPEGDLTDGLPENQELLDSIQLDDHRVDLRLERVTIGEGRRVWLFASGLVHLLPRLYADLGNTAIERYLPVVLVNQTVLDTALWQWLALLVLAVAVFAISGLLARLLLRVLRPIVARTSSEIDDALIAAVVTPVRFLVAVAAFRAGIEIIVPPVLVRLFIVRALVAAAYVGVAWLLIRLIDAGARELAALMTRRQRTSASSVVPLGRRTLKVLVIAIAIIATLNSWGYNTTALLTGLGLGGLAIALAAQKTLENLFGGVSLISDKPVLVGDFCKYGDNHMGTVEDIGLRSTRIRTLNRTVVTVPNGQFASMLIENFARRDRIWFHPILNIRCDATTEQMRKLLEDLRSLLNAHPRLAPDVRVRFIGIGSYSYDIEIFAYVLTADWNEFLGIQEELLLRILETVEAAGTAIAVPTQANWLLGETAPRDAGLELRNEARPRSG